LAQVVLVQQQIQQVEQQQTEAIPSLALSHLLVVAVAVFLQQMALLAVLVVVAVEPALVVQHLHLVKVMQDKVVALAAVAVVAVLAK
jgi:hypothetical protein